MRARTFARLGTALAGAAISTLAFAGAAQAASGTIMVPDDFNPAYSDTRATGHYEVQGTGLHIWTDGSIGSFNKVAEYVDTSTPLADVGAPSLSYTATSGTIPPGYQLIVDFDNDGTDDGILVGEPSYYGNTWWLNNAADADVKANAPHTGGGSGSNWFGTLAEWSANFPNATVKAFGFSLGSGVLGDGVINSITFAGTTYTFAAPVVLTSKDQCKKDGWKSSTSPVFKNQGDCVSFFASGK
jgi:hypothetical protein